MDGDRCEIPHCKRASEVRLPTIYEAVELCFDHARPMLWMMEQLAGLKPPVPKIPGQRLAADDTFGKRATDKLRLHHDAG